jgi:pimeloyl-ACP methyl ester carboxylesterase
VPEPCGHHGAATPEDLQRYLNACIHHDATDRLSTVTAPTLVLAGGSDSTARPELGRVVAEAIPGAVFEVLEGEAHQPFQEIPDTWNARVDAFWQDVEASDRARQPSRETADRVSSAGRSG